MQRVSVLNSVLLHCDIGCRAGCLKLDQSDMDGKGED